MRDSRTNYVLVGSFVLAMLGAMVVAIALISGRTGTTDAYYATYENVGGVKYGTSVLYEGFAIGQVQDIMPQRDSGKVTFRLRLEVKHDWPIPTDSVARVAASGLLAAVAIDVRGGTSPTLLKPGSQIPSQEGGNLFAAMSDIASQVTALSQTGLKPLVETLGHAVNAVAPMLEQRAPQLLDNLLSVSSDLADKTPRISSDLEKMSSGLNRVFSEANTRKMEDTIANADLTVANMAQLSGSLKESKAQVDDILAALDKAVAGNSDTVGQSLKDLRYSLQAVSRNIDSITYNLEGTSRNMNEFSREIRQNPGLLLGSGRPAQETGPRESGLR